MIDIAILSMTFLEKGSMDHLSITLDANEAVAQIAHAVNEVIAIYPITPASPMGEFADAWSTAGHAGLQQRPGNPRHGAHRPSRHFRKSYGKRGQSVLDRNFAAVDRALESLVEITPPAEATSTLSRRSPVPASSPDFVQRVTSVIIDGKGDLLPVSALPVDGTFPTGTSQYEKRGIAREIPLWDPDICIECGLCALVCPHAAIRMKAYEPERLNSAPDGFLSKPWKGSDLPGHVMTIQVAPDDCTGCSACVEICPAKSKEVAQHKAINMAPRPDHADTERTRFKLFLTLPEPDRSRVAGDSIKAFHEAQSWHGPSIILAYSHCIAHGIDMATANHQQKDLVKSGFWPLYRYDPRLAHDGGHPFHLDSHKPSIPFRDVAMKEARFAMNPDLSTRYLGLDLSNPLIVGSCPLTGRLDTLRQFEDAGAAAVVLPPLFEEQIEHEEQAIHFETLDVLPRLAPSSSEHIHLSLRWIAILRGRIDCSLAAAGGFRETGDVIKAHLAAILDGLKTWLAEKKYESIEQLKGSVSRLNCADPAAYERPNYLKALISYTGKFI